MKRNEIIHEHKKGVRAVKYNAKPKTHIEPPKTTNPVAKNANAAIGGGAAGAHKDAKKASQSVRGQKHKAAPEMAEGYNPNSVAAQHRREIQAHHEKEIRRKAETGDADAVKRLELMLKHKERMANDYNDRMEREGVEEMRDRRDSYQRDYDSSVSGMGDDFKRDFKRREMEHELGHETNNYAVAIDGRTWKVFGSKNHAQAVARSLQNKGKKATVHETGAEPTAEATGDVVGTVSSATPDGQVSIKTDTGSEIKTSKDALIPGASGTLQMKPDAAGDALKPGAKVVSTETSVINELDPPPNDSTSPIHGGREGSSHGEHNEIISLLRRMLARR